MGWFGKLKEGLKKTSSKLSDNISSVISRKKLDELTLEELEDALIMADIGVETSADIIKAFSKNKFQPEVSENEIKEVLATEITKILDPVTKKLEPQANLKPYSILMVGVNGNGKTTTIGKLAAKFKQDGFKSTIAACDTFRAAAVQQLEHWSEKSGSNIVKGEHAQDPASVAFQGISVAIENGSDFLFVDTAGRLHNKSNLMDELGKIKRVMQKHSVDHPAKTIIVIDASTGQNAINQIEEFSKIVNLDGVIVTKLDGTAKAGIIVAIAKKFKIPIYAVGVGEKIDDLNNFDAKEFANNLLGI